MTVAALERIREIRQMPSAEEAAEAWDRLLHDLPEERDQAPADPDQLREGERSMR